MSVEKNERERAIEAPVDEPAKLLFLGLSNAGKSMLLRRLMGERPGVLRPTIYPTAQELKIDSLSCTAYDFSGNRYARGLWKDYFYEADGIVFIVDAYDMGRFREAHAELRKLLSVKELSKIPFLILGNKLDHLECCSEADLRCGLGIRELRGRRPIELFGCSVFEGHGYPEGFQWLAQQIEKTRHRYWAPSTRYPPSLLELLNGCTVTV